MSKITAKRMGMNALWLLTLLVMFPQVVETIYSPALANIGQAFNVPPNIASQTLSVYFLAFAVGVFFWGRISDLYGRRPALLAGLLCYAVASLIALVAPSFTLLLGARVLAAFGASVGSVVVQTIFRDKYQGDELVKVFSLVGMALAISPAIGMFAGGELNHYWGYKGVFVALFILALLLMIFSSKGISETKPNHVQTASFIETACRMVKDVQIWLAVGLISALNISAFSYYTIAPFIFEQLDASGRLFGYTGIAMAIGSVCGSYLNKTALSQGVSSRMLFIIAIVLLLSGALGVLLLGHSLWFVLPMMLVMMSYAMTIPIILSVALNHYTDCRGSAGAILGVSYYLLIGVGLAAAGWLQNLGLMQLSLACTAVLLALGYQRYLIR